MSNLAALPDDELVALYERSKLPRGLRNNNPGNIEDGDFARGLPGYQGSDGRFAVFDSMESGQAAKGALLQSYGRRGFNTVEKVIGRWAPPSENDTGSYVQFVSQRLGVDPRQPLDLNDPGVVSSLQAAISERENGVPAMPNLASMSDEELVALYQQSAPGSQPPPGRTPPPGVLPPAATPAPRQLPTSQGLGFIKGATDPYATALDRQQTARGLLPQAAQAGLAVADMASPLGMLGQLGAMGVRQAQSSVRDRMAQGERPGGIGEFVGNVTATLPTWMLGPVTGGLMSGGMTSTADDVGGLARDVVIGGVAGKVADDAARFVAPKVGAALSRTAKPPTQEALRVAKKAAYDRLKALGGVYTGASKANLLAKFRADMARDGLDQGANPGAWAAFQRAEKVLGGKGPISLDDLDNLRQTAWRQAAGLKGADKEAERYYGEAMIRLIDDFVDTATPSSLSGATGPELSAAIKEARKANQIWRKTERINNTLESADLRAAAAYTGTNTDNTIRQQVRPLIDPTSSSRMRGVTPDEKKALQRIVRGSVGQNVARTTGQLVDPRRLLGMGLQGAGGVATGGLSLMSAPIGMLNTVLSNRASQQNVQRLLALVAAGGSKQAQVKVPTVTSRAIQAAVTAAPVAAPVGAVRAEDRRRTAGQTRR
jgi:hypothetical protein